MPAFLVLKVLPAVVEFLANVFVAVQSLVIAVQKYLIQHVRQQILHVLP